MAESNIGTIKAELMGAIRASMKDAAKVIKKVEQKNVSATVYDSYAPSEYRRRESAGGLMSEKNMHVRTKSSGNSVTLTVENTTPPNAGDEGNFLWTTDKDLVETVEYGIVGNYDFPNCQTGSFSTAEMSALQFELGPYTDPRPFVQNTAKELLTKKEHIKAVKDSLRAMGYKVK